jgi:hypothetical protein
MRTKMKLKVTVLAVLASCSFGVATAGEVSGMTTFSSGSKAVASQVNGNFNAVKTAVGDNNSRLGTVEADVAQISNTAGLDRGRITNLESQDSIQTNSLTNLNARAVLSEQSAQEPLSIVRGCIDPAGAVIGTVYTPTTCGAGFIWRKDSTGTFLVAFDTYYYSGTDAFDGVPAVTANTQSGAGVFASVYGDGPGNFPTGKWFFVRTYDAVASGTESVSIDVPFSFTAIGRTPPL